MHKSIRYTAISAALAAAMLVQPISALADEIGPGIGLSPEMAGSSPIAGDSGSSAQTEQSGVELTLAEKVAAAGLTLPDEGDLPPDSILNLVPLFSAEMRDANGNLLSHAASYDDSYCFSENGFSSLYLVHQNVGRYYYRTYTAEHGWSAWATSTEATPATADGAKVQAIQVRVKGYTHNLADLYYKVVLNDGTVLDWAKDGQTTGTMGTDKYIVGMKLALWKKGVPFTQPTQNLMLAQAYEGLYTDENGQVQYSTFDGRAYTGWAYDGDSNAYYFAENTRLSGWHYIEGYKYYFDESGKLVKDLEPIMGLQSSYQIRYNKATKTMYIMAKDGDNGYIIPFKTFMSACGPDTPLGSYKTYAKYRWKFMHDDIYCQYLSRFYQGFIIHSLLYYDSPSPYALDAITYNYIDDAVSGGCIRLRAMDCEWVYTNCPMGTEVVIYEDKWNKGPVEKDAIEQAIPRDQNYDPTDSTVIAEQQKKALSEQQMAEAEAAQKQAIQDEENGIVDPAPIN